MNEGVFDAAEDEDKPSGEKEYACESVGCEYSTAYRWVLKRHCDRLAHYSSSVLNLPPKSRPKIKRPGRPKKYVEGEPSSYACESPGCDYVVDSDADPDMPGYTSRRQGANSIENISA